MKTRDRFLSIFLLLAGALAAAEPNLAADPAAPKSEKGQRVIASTDGGRVFMSHLGEGEKVSVAFLGVETAPVSATLTAQLGLPDGLGLVVNKVFADSAAAAVLKDHDILLKLDDQLLVNREQLSALVRQHKEGDEVTLTYVRAGKQATAKARLGKHDVPKMSALFGNVPFIYQNRTVEAPEAREDVDRVLSLIQRSQGAPDAPAGAIAPSAHVHINRDGPGISAMSVNTDNSNIVFSDDAGSLELTIKDGRKSLVAKNPKGEQVFAGPVTTPDERKALPAEIRGRLEKLEGMQHLTFRTDGDFEGAETRVIGPAGRGVRYVLPPPAPRLPTFY